MGEYDVPVSAQGPGGETAQTTVVVTLPWPNGPPKDKIAVHLGKGVTLAMVLIPAGRFTMGSPFLGNDAHNEERPQHRVRITKPFYLGTCPVTQEQWAAVMGNNPSAFKGPKNPVEQVSWDDCQQFLDKLARFRRAQPGNLPPDRGEFQLPTEAQWEYSCRAGSTTQYCFGDDEAELGEYAWFDKNSGGKTHPAGEKKPNAWGLHDVHGNVWEWCQDWYDGGYYTTCAISELTSMTPTSDPNGPSAGSFRVVRGGDWQGPATACRSAIRGRYTPENRRSFLGFRVARVAVDK